jgi:hypothetical protein
MLSMWGLTSVDRMINECGAATAMKIGSGNRSTLTKPISIPRCPPQIQYWLNWDRIREAVVGNWRLTSRDMERP